MQRFRAEDAKVCHSNRSNGGSFLTSRPRPQQRRECQNRGDARKDESRLDGEVLKGKEDRASDDKNR
jgi:hypothetical protein